MKILAYPKASTVPKSKTHLLLIALVSLTIISLTGKANAAADITSSMSSSTPSYDNPELHYTQGVRLSILGGGGAAIGQSSAETTDGSTPKNQIVDGGLLLDFGHGKWGFATGLQYLQMPAIITASASGIADQTTVASLGYIGVPLEVRYNYIEHPMAVLSLNMGIMPAYLVSPETTYTFGSQGDANYASTTIQSSDVMVIAGFTGTGPISNDVGFLIDATVFYGLMTIDGIARNEGVLLSAGFTFGL